MRRSEEWGDAERFPTSLSGNPASPTENREASLRALPSHHYQRAEAVIRPHIAATFGFRPRHIDTWQWSLVMDARLFLETQGTVWWWWWGGWG